MIASPVAQCLFVGCNQSTRLLAARSRSDRTFRFPIPVRADEAPFDIVELGPAGSLWSYTIQRFRPKPPFNGRGGESDFKPFAVGYVEFPEQLIIEGRIVGDDFGALRIGLGMVLTTEAYREDEAGEPVLTYAFAVDRTAGRHP